MCNGNGIIDGCDLSSAGGCASISGSGQSADCQNDGIPDECQLVIPGCDGVRYDSGFADLVNAVRPDDGWWFVGIADDFTLDAAVEGFEPGIAASARTVLAPVTALEDVQLLAQQRDDRRVVAAARPLVAARAGGRGRGLQGVEPLLRELQVL